MTLPQKHIFTDLKKFQNICDFKLLNTAEFLDSLKEFISVYDILGPAFYLPKRDIIGNIKKLEKTYNRDKEKYKYLYDMILHEKSDKSLYAVSGLLWLKRALEYTVQFFKLLKTSIDDEENGKSYRVAQLAYQQTLKMYHGWFTQNIFMTVVQSCPSRDYLITIMYFGMEGSEEELMCSACNYLASLENNLDAIQNILNQWNLDSNDVV